MIQLASSRNRALQRPRRIGGFALVVTICLLAVFATVPPMRAQAPRAASDWSRVQAVTPGTTVEVRAQTRHLHCKVSSVTEDVLFCTQAASEPPTALQRSEIRSIRTSHRGRSALIGAGVGGGGLAIAAFSAATTSGGLFGDNFLRGPVTGIGALTGVVVGGGLGALTDFCRSTIYRAP